MQRPLTALALSLSLLGAASARAELPAPPMPPQQPMQEQMGQGGGHAELRAIFAQLGLSAEQKGQLRGLRQAKAEQDKQARREFRDARHAFAQAMTGNSSDDALRAAHAQLIQKREALAALRFEGLLEVRRILTPDQRSRFDALYIDYRRGKAQRAGEE